MPAATVSHGFRHGTVPALIALAAVLGAAMPAAAQAARDQEQRIIELARKFQEATPCTLSGATDALKASAVGATPEEALVALGMLIRTENLCSPVRNAAEELRGTYAGQIAAADPVGLPAAPPQAPAAVAVVEAPHPVAPPVSVNTAAAVVPDDRTLVARLQFEVGPPPPNLTRGRVSTP